MTLLQFRQPEPPNVVADSPQFVGQAQCRNSPEHVWTAVVPYEANPFELECPEGCGMTGHLLVGDYVVARREYERLRERVLQAADGALASLLWARQP